MPYWERSCSKSKSLRFIALILCSLGCVASEDFCEFNDCNGLIYIVDLHGSEIGSNRILSEAYVAPTSFATLKFRVKFKEGFQWVRGGKMLGLGPRFPITGGRDSTPLGWSVRLMFKEEGKLAIYSYLQDRVLKWGDGPMTGASVLKSDVWNEIEIVVKLNEVDSPGFVKVCVDRKLVLKMTDVKFRSEYGQDSQISRLLFHVFYGGHTDSWAPRNLAGDFSSSTIYFKDVEVVPIMHRSGKQYCGY